MKRSKFFEEQAVYALREAEAGTLVGDLCRQLGVAEATFYAWKKKYAHLGVSELGGCVSWKKKIPGRNGSSPISPWISTCSRKPAKKSLRAARRQELAAWFQGTFQVSCLRACRVAQFSRAAWYRRSRAGSIGVAAPDSRSRPCPAPIGYVRILVLLRREGWLVNRTRVRRLYRLDGLQLRMRVRRRKHIALHRGAAPIPIGPTECWSMDFVHDTLAEGRPFRVLPVVDNWSRQSPLLEVGFRMSGETVGQTLDRVLGDGAGPRSITVDPGTEFESRALEDWAYRRRVQLDSFGPGNPWKTPLLSRLTVDCETSI